jgi:hypothetical protein
MTTKPKTRKAPAAALDPVFAAIAGHKVLIRESNRIEESCRIARAEAEKKYGEWISAPHDWPGEAIVAPFYDRWNRVGNVERKAALRMARTQPATTAGVAALITHARREIAAVPERAEDWVTIALKTAAAVLFRMTPPKTNSASLMTAL